MNTPTTTSPRIDAHWYAAEGLAAAVVHGMLIQPARVDITAAMELGDWKRAMASSNECLRWIAACHETLDGRGTAARTGIEMDLVIAATDRSDPIDAMREIVAHPDVTRQDAERAVQATEEAEARLVERLPLELPVHRTPTGFQPSTDVVSQLEKLRHRLGLPPFDWEAWIG